MQNFGETRTDSPDILYSDAIKQLSELPEFMDHGKIAITDDNYAS